MQRSWRKRRGGYSSSRRSCSGCRRFGSKTPSPRKRQLGTAAATATSVSWQVDSGGPWKLKEEVIRRQHLEALVASQRAAIEELQAAINQQQEAIQRIFLDGDGADGVPDARELEETMGRAEQALAAKAALDSTRTGAGVAVQWQRHATRKASPRAGASQGAQFV